MYPQRTRTAPRFAATPATGRQATQEKRRLQHRAPERLIRNPLLRLWDGCGNTSRERRPYVRVLQQALLDHGYQLQVDGCLGRRTLATVKNFQRRQGLSVDGVVGPQTWARLYGQLSPDAEWIQFDTLHDPADIALRAQRDVAARYRRLVNAIVAPLGLPASVVVGLVSRESQWGLGLSPQGPAGTQDTSPRLPLAPQRLTSHTADGLGYRRGLMGIDYDFHPFARETSAWQDPEQNLRYGIDLLSRNYEEIQQHLELTGEPLLRAAVAAYNAGVGHVLDALRHGRDPDFHTVGRDYARDVLSRAGWFQLWGWS